MKADYRRKFKSMTTEQLESYKSNAVEKLIKYTGFTDTSKIQSEISHIDKILSNNTQSN